MASDTFSGSFDFILASVLSSDFAQDGQSKELFVTQEISKNKGDVIFSTSPLGRSFGGCLHNERLRSSGAKSGLLHLLACGVRCGMDALHFELEVVRIAGVLQCG